MNIRGETIHSDSISLRTYFKDLRKIEMLKGDEQIRLAIEAKAGNKQAMEKLIRCNLRFVLSIAKEYQQSGMPLEDLISEGNLGLIKSIERFDASKGFKFISYAVWWIRQSILQAIYEDGNTVRLPVNKINAINKINKVKEKLYKELSREPTDGEISKLSDISEEEVRCYYLDGNYEISLNAKVSGDPNSEGEMGDFIEGDGLETLESNLNRDSLHSELSEILSNLTDREYQILRMYFGLDGGDEMTLNEIGRQLKLTNERVRQIKEFALRKLRMYQRSSKLKEFLNYKIAR